MPDPPERALSDGALVAASRAGGPRARDAYGELVRRHQQWLVRLLRYVLGDAQLSEDVAQDAFVRGFAAIHAAPTDGFRPWLRVIATRLAYNRRRDRATRERYHEAAPPPAVRSADDERTAARESLEQVLAQLSYPYREILVLRYVEELELDEIAKLLDLGPSAARMRLKRARDRFQVIYAELT